MGCVDCFFLHMELGTSLCLPRLPDALATVKSRYRVGLSWVGWLGAFEYIVTC